MIRREKMSNDAIFSSLGKCRRGTSKRTKAMLEHTLMVAEVDHFIFSRNPKLINKYQVACKLEGKKPLSEWQQRVIKDELKAIFTYHDLKYAIIMDGSG